MPKQMAAFIYSPEMERYHYPDECPFNTRRAGLTRSTCDSMGLLDGSDRVEVEPVMATRTEAELYHVPRYLDALQRADEGHFGAEEFSMGLGTADCPVFRGMYPGALLASGASITGARLILSGEAMRVFNPSGGLHHAHADHASGFCYINDIVLAAMTLASAGKRVLFLDIDVHHSDGVQHAFWTRRDVMTVSLHESGKTLFPGTGAEDEIGEGDGRGYSVNIPLPVGTHDAIYLKAFREAALPLIKAFNPDVLIVEVGMDTLAGDPMAHLHLTNNVAVDVMEAVLSLGKPVLVTGGGGYNVANTVRGWALVWSVLCGDHLDAMMYGMGGVMMENTDWAGGLRDRVLLSDAGRRGEVDREVDESIRRVQSLVFPLHGL